MLLTWHMGAREELLVSSRWVEQVRPMPGFDSKWRPARMAVTSADPLVSSVCPPLNSGTWFIVPETVYPWVKL